MGSIKDQNDSTTKQFSMNDDSYEDNDDGSDDDEMTHCSRLNKIDNDNLQLENSNHNIPQSTSSRHSDSFNSHILLPTSILTPHISHLSDESSHPLSLAPPPLSVENSISVLTNSIMDMYSSTIEPQVIKDPNQDDEDDFSDPPAVIPFLPPTASNTLKSTWHGNNAGYDITFLNNLGNFFLNRALYYHFFSILIIQPLKQLLLDVNIYIEVLSILLYRFSN
jgi:hypothetical protein